MKVGFLRLVTFLIYFVVGNAFIVILVSPGENRKNIVLNTETVNAIKKVVAYVSVFSVAGRAAWTGGQIALAVTYPLFRYAFRRLSSTSLTAAFEKRKTKKQKRKKEREKREVPHGRGAARGRVRGGEGPEEPGLPAAGLREVLPGHLVRADVRRTGVRRGSWPELPVCSVARKIMQVSNSQNLLVGTRACHDEMNVVARRRPPWGSKRSSRTRPSGSRWSSPWGTSPCARRPPTAC